jgi:hypothetical protein
MNIQSVTVIVAFLMDQLGRDGSGVSVVHVAGIECGTQTCFSLARGGFLSQHFLSIVLSSLVD